MRVATTRMVLELLTDPFYVDKQKRSSIISLLKEIQDVVLYAKCNIEEKICSVTE